MKHHPTCKFLISGKNPKGCVLIKGSYSHVSQFPLFRTDNPFIKMMDNQAAGIYIHGMYIPPDSNLEWLHTYGGKFRRMAKTWEKVHVEFTLLHTWYLQGVQWGTFERYVRIILCIFPVFLQTTPHFPEAHRMPDSFSYTCNAFVIIISPGFSICWAFSRHLKVAGPPANAGCS